MSWLLPKTYLKWREPENIRQAWREIEEKRRSPWVRPIGVIAHVLMLMLLWFISRYIIGSNPPALWIILLLGLGLGMFMGYFVPWLIRHRPSIIRVNEKAVVRIAGDQAHWLHYKKIKSCLIAKKETDAGPVSVLVVTLIKGGSVTIGIDDKVSLEELQRVLAERGVQVILG